MNGLKIAFKQNAQLLVSCLFQIGDRQDSCTAKAFDVLNHIIETAGDEECSIAMPAMLSCIETRCHLAINLENLEVRTVWLLILSRTLVVCINRLQLHDFELLYPSSDARIRDWLMVLLLKVTLFISRTASSPLLSFLLLANSSFVGS